MSGDLDSVTAVDLSRLPAPTVVEQIPFETIVAARTAEFQALLPDYDTFLETDPVVIAIQAGAYRELLLRQRFNERAVSVMLAYAAGADLDNLAAFYGVTRLEIVPADPETGATAVMEGDTELRRRVSLAPDSFTVAGPRTAYIFHALSADGAILDANATSIEPGQVIVSVLARDGDGTADEDLLDAVAAVVNDDEVRPLTDQVTVQSASIVEFAIAAVLHIDFGPDPDIVLANAQARIDAWLEANRRIGRSHSLSGIYAQLHVEGVNRVELTSPVADVDISAIEAPYCTDVALTVVT